MKVLMLGHYSRTGKDSLANFIESYSEGFIETRKVSFAWKLKDVCCQLYGWAGLREPEFYETAEGASLRNETLPLLGKTPIEIWVDFGTKAVRDKVYEDTWIQHVLQQDYDDVDLLIIPDGRFFNEIKIVSAHCKARGWEFKHVKLLRPGYGPKNTVADTSLSGYCGWDYYAGGTMGDLQCAGIDFSYWARGSAWPTQTPEEIERIKGYEISPKDV